MFNANKFNLNFVVDQKWRYMPLISVLLIAITAKISLPIATISKRIVKAHNRLICSYEDNLLERRTIWNVFICIVIFNLCFKRMYFKLSRAFGLSENITWLLPHVVFARAFCMNVKCCLTDVCSFRIIHLLNDLLEDDYINITIIYNACITMFKVPWLISPLTKYV